MRVRMADGASATPSSPPAKARRTLSARSCLPMRHPRSAQSQASTDFMVASRSTRQEEVTVHGAVQIDPIGVLCEACRGRRDSSAPMPRSA